jgi:dCMP deaminase
MLESCLTLSNWDLRFYELCNYVANWSKDPIRQVGAVIAKDKFRFIVGYNGFPPNIGDDLRRLGNNSIKQELINHAEVNAILNSAKNNFGTDGCTLYVGYHPCHNCAKAVIGAGITRVVCPPAVTSPASKWFKSQSLASDMLYEADVLVLYPNV